LLARLRTCSLTRRLTHVVPHVSVRVGPTVAIVAHHVVVVSIGPTVATVGHHVATKPAFYIGVGRSDRPDGGLRYWPLRLDRRLSILRVGVNFAALDVFGPVTCGETLIPR